MAYLLDTHILLWFLTDQRDKISPEIVDILLDERNPLYFSTVSIWEIAIKNQMGRTDFHFPPEIISQELLRQGFIHLNIELNHIFALNQLPLIHKDPFDRLLIAQAHSEKLNLLTADTAILQYPYDSLVDIRP
ncbi:type II toxin-antitoxin system VapC family toxin [Wielerella bovis]|uniref:type II toxin-antitoxin system VapC family toxin n=1 Tax=Wielerella bovis TaxID=2917790 RepID=UPI002019E24A|nr:type II toxin-antitoxin system VapC family toxin [Wielerella bovis]ULJ62013.1 type II toxin-antitoxin system VapC family toxin [Wielerella bovis]